jgi:hypothetical protein
MGLNAISKEEMKGIVGGKKIVSIYFKNDSEGTYFEITYDDGSVDYVPHTWYA